MVEGDNCAVGPEGKVNQNFEIRQLKRQDVGSHCIMNSRVPKTRSPGYRRPKVLKYQKLKFRTPENTELNRAQKNHEIETLS